MITWNPMLTLLLHQIYHCIGQQTLIIFGGTPGECEISNLKFSKHQQSSQIFWRTATGKPVIKFRYYHSASRDIFVGPNLDELHFCTLPWVEISWLLWFGIRYRYSAYWSELFQIARSGAACWYNYSSILNARYIHQRWGVFQPSKWSPAHSQS